MMAAWQFCALVLGLAGERFCRVRRDMSGACHGFHQAFRWVARMSPSPRRQGKSPQKHQPSSSPARRPKASESGQPAATGQRLQKILAAAGVASRRECEERILQGRVEVDRQVITELGFRVDPDAQEIRVDGLVLPRPKHVYFLVHKPMGVVSTSRDPARRMRVIDLVPDQTRMFTVGRLDRSSEGLILVTNDGELANQLTHPRYGIPKTYRAQVLGFPTPETLQKLRKGVYLAEGVARVAELRARGRHPRGAELELVLNEGRNREIRRILARVGHKVLRLRRVALGPLRLGNLMAGESRRLTPAEVQSLRNCVRDQQRQALGKTNPKELTPTDVPVADTDVDPFEDRPQRSTSRSTARPTGRPPRGPKRPATRTDSRGQGRGATERPGRPGRPGQGGFRKPKSGAVLDYDLSPGGEKVARPPRARKSPSGKSGGRKAVGKRKRT